MSACTLSGQSIFNFATRPGLLQPARDDEPLPGPRVSDALGPITQRLGARHLWRLCGVDCGSLLGARRCHCLPRAVAHAAVSLHAYLLTTNFTWGQTVRLRNNFLLCILHPPFSTLASYDVRHITLSYSPPFHHRRRLHHERACAQWPPLRAHLAQQPFCQEPLHILTWL